MKKKQGISLIVLSITILVMAILAATVIISLENSGIIGRSRDTVNKQNYNEEYQRLIVIKNGILTDNLGEITVDEYIAELTNKGIIESTVTTNADGTKTVTTKTGFKVTIGQNGEADLNIEVDESNSNSGNTSSDSNDTSNDSSGVEYQLSGDWKWNDSMVFPTGDMNQEITFTASEMAPDISEYTSINYIGNSMIMYDGDMYDVAGGYIYFGSTPQTVSQEFYEWFTANATQQTATLISFTIDGTSYQAEEGMTWSEWAESSYNSSTLGFYVYESYINTSAGKSVTYMADLVLSDDVINNGYVYETSFELAS